MVILRVTVRTTPQILDARKGGSFARLAKGGGLGEWGRIGTSFGPNRRSPPQIQEDRHCLPKLLLFYSSFTLISFPLPKATTKTTLPTGKKCLRHIYITSM
jgi:hypothetical protein